MRPAAAARPIFGRFWSLRAFCFLSPPAPSAHDFRPLSLPPRPSVTFVSARSPEHIAALVAQAAEHWRTQGSRITHVRRIVCEQAFASLSPFDAETLLVRARAVDRAISLASVYRTLSQLVACDLLRSVPGTHGERHYTVVDAPAAGMSHIVCTDCDRIFPLPDPCLPLREGALARQHGFHPQSMTLRVEASCEEYRRNGSCTRHASASVAPS